MCFVGVYDSGIGGLTTLFALKKVFDNLDFFYLADTKSNPLGTKTREEIIASVQNGIDILKRHTVFQIVACNTASTVVRPNDAFLLKPDLKNLDPKTTLLLCTPATEKALKLQEKGYLTADTKHLASMVETTANLSFENRDISIFNNLEKPMKNLTENKMKCHQIDRIYLGCSHYLFFKSVLEKLYPDVEIIDGNKSLENRLKARKIANVGQGEITFHFTLKDESEKYRWLLEKMSECPDILNI